jgi:hypothetical protein
MRSARGIQLLEMVIAVGLSGIFVVLLTGMLSQTLSLSTSSQNQIIAGAIADQLAEQIQSGNFVPPQQLETPITFPDQSGLPNGPCQLDVAREIYGVFNGGTRWQATTGNQFRGTLAFKKLNNGCTYLITVTYPSSGGQKQLTRLASYWTYGAGGT